MAKKINQKQVDGNIVNSIIGNYIDNTDPKNPKSTLPTNIATETYVNSQGFLTDESDPWGMQSMVVTGTTTKNLTATLRNGSTISASWADLNTTYNAMTSGDLANGTDTENKLIAAVTLVNYINSRLAATMRYKGQVTNYANLPTANNQIGDVYNIVNANTSPEIKAGDNVAWNGTTWDVLAGFVDTSMFLTAETDPTGVKSVVVTGTTSKTLTITLNNNTTKVVTWNDTSYASGILADLQAGTSTVAKLWSEKILNDWLNGKNFATIADVTTFFGSQRNDMFVIVGGNISGNTVTLNLTATRKSTSVILAFYNGVKIPAVAMNLNAQGTQITINQLQIPTPIEVGEEVEVVYMG